MTGSLEGWLARLARLDVHGSAGGTPILQYPNPLGAESEFRN